MAVGVTAVLILLERFALWQLGRRKLEEKPKGDEGGRPG